MNKIYNKINSFVYRLSIKEQMFFVKRLSFLIGAGIPLLQSLLLIEEQTKSKRMAKIVSFLIREVSSGQFLSNGLKKSEYGFDHFSINVIGVGETAGILSKNLEYLAEELKKRETLRKKILGAFIYPIIVLFSTICMMVFIMTYLFPKITPVFKSLKTDLPFSTKTVIFVSDFLTNNGLFLFLFTLICFGIFYWLFTKNIFFITKFHNLLIKLPFVGSLVVAYNLSHIARSIGLLLKSDLSMSESISTTSTIIKNPIYKNEFERMSEKIIRGEFISTHLKDNKNLFPEIFYQIIFVGEQSGNLSDSFLYLSNFYESEINEWSKNISNLVEPVFMIIVGLLVGFVAISIISPIYGITQSFGQK